MQIRIGIWKWMVLQMMEQNMEIESIRISFDERLSISVKVILIAIGIRLTFLAAGAIFLTAIEKSES